MGALKLLHRISVVTFDLDLWPILYILLQNATPSPFITRFRFRLLYMMALGEGFKTPTQNFDLWLLWPLTLIFWPILYILLQNATPSPFLTRFRFRLLYVMALGEGFKTSTQNFDLWLLWPLTLIFWPFFELVCNFNRNSSLYSYHSKCISTYKEFFMVSNFNFNPIPLTTFLLFLYTDYTIYYIISLTL